MATPRISATAGGYPRGRIVCTSWSTFYPVARRTETCFGSAGRAPATPGPSPPVPLEYTDVVASNRKHGRRAGPTSADFFAAGSVASRDTARRVCSRHASSRRRNHLVRRSSVMAGRSGRSPLVRRPGRDVAGRPEPESGGRGTEEGGNDRRPKKVARRRRPSRTLIGVSPRGSLA